MCIYIYIYIYNNGSLLIPPTIYFSKIILPTASIIYIYLHIYIIYIIYLNVCNNIYIYNI